MNTQEDDAKMLNELDEFLADKKDPASGTTAGADMSADPASRPGCPDEIITYEAMTVMIWEQTERLFAWSRDCDPHSRQYIKACRLMERAVSHLGSALVTKAAISQNNKVFPKLEGLTSGRLMEILSGCMKKCDEAVRQSYESEHGPDLTLIGEMLRIGNTTNRLRSTHWKSFLLERFFIEAKDIPGQACSLEEQYQRTKENVTQEPGGFRSAPSFEIRGDIVAAANGGEPVRFGKASGRIREDGSVPSAENSPAVQPETEGNEKKVSGETTKDEETKTGDAPGENNAPVILLPAGRSVPAEDACNAEDLYEEEDPDEDEEAYQEWLNDLPPKEELYEIMTDEEKETAERARNDPELFRKMVESCKHPEVFGDDWDAFMRCMKIIIYLSSA